MRFTGLMSETFDHRTIKPETPGGVLFNMKTEDPHGVSVEDNCARVHPFAANCFITEKYQAKEVMRYIQRQCREYDIARWTVFKKKSERLAGWAGLQWVSKMLNGIRQFYDIEYQILPEFQGRDMSTEWTSKAIAFAFIQMEIPLTYTTRHCGNQASVSMLNHAGFECNGIFTHNVSEQYFFSLSREKWIKN